MVTVIVEKIAGEPEIRPSEEKNIDTEKGDTIITIYVSKTPLPSKKGGGTGNKKLGRTHPSAEELAKMYGI